MHVCQLCGCWYETRKGLCSHARAHLRHIGIPDSDIKGSPIDMLYQIMEEEDLKPITSKKQGGPPFNKPPKPASKRPLSLSPSPAPPPSKHPKLSCACALCGEEFSSRKGLSSHCRSHLRQLGVTEVLGKTSPIDTVEELISSGMLQPTKSPKAKRAPKAPAKASPTSPALSPAQSQSQASLPSTSASSSQESSPMPSPVSRAPKAKKGFRLAVDPLYRKPKPEPVEMEVFYQSKGSSSSSLSPLPKTSLDADPVPLSAGKATGRYCNIMLLQTVIQMIHHGQTKS